MAPEITSATEATKIATTFLKQYYSFVRPVSAAKEKDIWHIKVDIGILSNQIIEIEISASDGGITKYELPR